MRPAVLFDDDIVSRFQYRYILASRILPTWYDKTISKRGVRSTVSSPSDRGIVDRDELASMSSLRMNSRGPYRTRRSRGAGWGPMLPQIRPRGGYRTRDISSPWKKHAYLYAVHLGRRQRTPRARLACTTYDVVGSTASWKVKLVPAFCGEEVFHATTSESESN